VPSIIDPAPAHHNGPAPRWTRAECLPSSSGGQELPELTAAEEVEDARHAVAKAFAGCAASGLRSEPML
jgi:hypothetical protein